MTRAMTRKNTRTMTRVMTHVMTRVMTRAMTQAMTMFLTMTHTMTHAVTLKKTLTLIIIPGGVCSIVIVPHSFSACMRLSCTIHLLLVLLCFISISQLLHLGH